MEESKTAGYRRFTEVRYSGGNCRGRQIHAPVSKYIFFNIPQVSPPGPHGWAREISGGGLHAIDPDRDVRCLAAVLRVVPRRSLCRGGRHDQGRDRAAADRRAGEVRRDRAAVFPDGGGGDQREGRRQGEEAGTSLRG